MNNDKQKSFFLLLKEIYKILPESFKRQILYKDFYRYIQDKRKELKAEYTTLKDVNDDNFHRFNYDFFSFVYLNIVNYYYSINITNKIKLELDKKFKHYFKKDGIKN